MSTPEAPHPAPATAPAGKGPAYEEIRVYSHSMLFYWWPVWLFGFLFALITWMDNYRIAVVPGDTAYMVKSKGADGKDRARVDLGDGHQMANVTDKATDEQTQKYDQAHPGRGANDELYRIKPRLSAKSWMGPLYLIILFLVIIITNVPLRGLWSLVVMIGLVVLALVISLFNWWDDIFDALYGLHVFINLAGYLFLASVLFIVWALAVFIFDRRSYIIFTPGQIRVCEAIGTRERTYDTTGMTVEKFRDDWFRHIFLGFGSGDLSVRTAGADRHEILMPNVALIGFKIDPIQQLIRQRQIETVPNRQA
ncbi:MAG TPA: hypothetical protein VKE40_04760 [Gemmataceae bacterium]|nr:hypothetical protein [Gemmataceae bacterium]